VVRALAGSSMRGLASVLRRLEGKCRLSAVNPYAKHECKIRGGEVPQVCTLALDGGE
jgi:hypothetical protein